MSELPDFLKGWRFKIDAHHFHRVYWVNLFVDEMGKGHWCNFSEKKDIINRLFPYHVLITTRGFAIDKDEKVAQTLDKASLNGWYIGPDVGEVIDYSIVNGTISYTLTYHFSNEDDAIYFKLIAG